MTREEFDEMSLYDLIDIAQENDIDIQSRDIMKEVAKDKIDSDEIFFAFHILEALNNSDADWFIYDFGMGTLEEPTPVDDKDDLLDAFEYMDLIEESVCRSRRRINKESIERDRRIRRNRQRRK